MPRLASPANLTPRPPTVGACLYPRSKRAYHDRLRLTSSKPAQTLGLLPLPLRPTPPTVSACFPPSRKRAYHDCPLALTSSGPTSCLPKARTVRILESHTERTLQCAVQVKCLLIPYVRYAVSPSPTLPLRRPAKRTLQHGTS